MADVPSSERTGPGQRCPLKPTSATAIVFYQLHFQQPGAAEAELEASVRATVRDVMLRLSGDVPAAPGSDGFSMVPLAGGLKARMGQYASLPLPAWLTEADIAYYASELGRSGFRGDLNWYRNIDRNWALLRPFAGAKIQVPALYVAGDRDLVVSFPGAQQAIAGMKDWIPRLRDIVMLPGCGHWTKQERSAEVNAAMLSFLRSL